MLLPGLPPYLDRIQAAFGAEHELGGVQAHVGGADASERIGAGAHARPARAAGEDILAACNRSD